MALVDNVWYVDFGDGATTGYYAVAGWSNHTAVAGEIIRQATTPAVGSERCFVCATAGATGAVEPTWTVTRGALNTSSVAVYQECTGIAALNGDVTNTPNWTTVKNTAVTLGQVIKRNNAASFQICTVAGTAGNAAEPAFSDTAGTTMADNTVTWTSLGVVGNFTGWQAPHARLTNAYASTWGQAGNSFFVASESNETQSVAMTLTSPGSLASPCIVDCVAKTPVPPTTTTTGATISTTGASALTIQANVGAVFYQGITFQAGSAANAANIAIGSTNQPYYVSLVNCSLTLTNTSASSSFQIGNAGVGQYIFCNGCTWTFGSVAGQGFTGSLLPVRLEIVGGSVVVGATVITTLFKSGVGSVQLEGVDLSALGSGHTLMAASNQLTYGQIKDCKLGASVTVAATPTAPNSIVDVIRSDSTGTNYRSERTAYTATLTTETTIIRTSGASDGTTGISWKIATTANSKWVLPFKAFPIQINNTTLATNRTVTLHGICQLAALPNNDDTWFDVEYLGSAASPLGSFGSGTKANNLATGSPLTADTASDWTSQAAAYQTAHAYGAFTGVIKAGNASPQQLWFMSSHSGTGTSGGSSAIFNGIADGAQVTDNSGANQIVWQAMMRFILTVTLSAPQPAQAGYLFATIKAAKASTTYWWDPLIALG